MTTIKDKSKWIDHCGIAGMTATEWLNQVLGYERKTSIAHKDVMSNLRIGGWQHSMHYSGNFGIENTDNAREKLLDYTTWLAAELDKRLHDLTAVENEIGEMIKETQASTL